MKNFRNESSLSTLHKYLSFSHYKKGKWILWMYNGSMDFYCGWWQTANGFFCHSSIEDRFAEFKIVSGLLDC